VCSIEPYDNSIEVQINNELKLLSEKMAEHLKLIKIE